MPGPGRHRQHREGVADGLVRPPDAGDAGQIRAVTYEGLVNVVDAAGAARFTGRFVLVSGMGSELPSFTGRLLNAIKGDLQRNQRDRDAYLRNSGLDWSIGRGGVLTDEPGGRVDICITPPPPPLDVAPRRPRGFRLRANCCGRRPCRFGAHIRRVQRAWLAPYGRAACRAAERFGRILNPTTARSDGPRSIPS